ncbi:hypothetical protein CDIK_0384 [Cucumispora dikerogammari]|nr:hypothetical protein CDIK_0384 [Cucumispora dikerogammari]
MKDNKRSRINEDEYHNLILYFKNENMFDYKKIDRFILLSRNKQPVFIKKLADFLKVNDRDNRYVKYLKVVDETSFGEDGSVEVQSHERVNKEVFKKQKRATKKSIEKDAQRQLLKQIKKENKQTRITKRLDSIKEKEEYKKKVKKMYSKIFSQKE